MFTSRITRREFRGKKSTGEGFGLDNRTVAQT
jgi:hypothetical protein